MIWWVLSVITLLIFSRLYKRHLKRIYSASTLNEKNKRSLGQATTCDHGDEMVAHHGLIADEETGHFYTQCRLTDEQEALK